MTYDLEKLSIRIKKDKSKFITKLTVLSSLALVCILLMLLSGMDEIIIISGIVLFVIFFIARNLFNRYNPKILFSKEIRGENIKEGEYEIMKRGSHKTGGMRYKQVGSRGGIMPYAPNTGANRKVFHKDQHFSGEVYLRKEDGNVLLIRGLYISQMEIYEEGDTLLKPAGVKFPIVISRCPKCQPCPLCGEVNGIDRLECGGCGLSILKQGVEYEHEI